MVQLSQTFGALADDNRLVVLTVLGDRGSATAGELAEPLGITVTGLLKHVAVLEGAGLVVSSKEGRVRRCRLGPERLDDAAHWLAGHQRRWERRVDRFERYLDDLTEGAP